MNQTDPEKTGPLEAIEAGREEMQAAQPRDWATRLRYNYEELIGQPEAIATTLTKERERIQDVADAFARRVDRRIYSIGCGDSWATSQAVRAPFEQLLGLPFEPLQALEFARYAVGTAGPGDAVIGLSASGTTPETAKGLELAREAGALTIGATMAADSPFTEVAERFLLVHAIRRASFPTQASTANLALLLALAAQTALQLGRNLDQARQFQMWLDDLPPLVAQIIAVSEPVAASIATRWLAQEAFTFVGAGPGLAAAMFGAAKIREGFEGYGWAIGTEEFHHYEIVHQGDPVFLVAPKDVAYSRAVDVAVEVKKAGGVLYSVITEGEETISAISDAAFYVPPLPTA